MGLSRVDVRFYNSSQLSPGFTSSTELAQVQIKGTREMSDNQVIDIPSKDFIISGLPITAWNYPPPPDAKLACLFLLHGRLCTATTLDPFIHRLIIDANARRANEPRAKHLILISFDHRNHGHRLQSLKANHSWNTHPNMPGEPIENPNHALDMYAIQTGTADDVSMLVDFLPAYLFPHPSQTISAWGVIGFSLGGHSAWLTGASDPRIRFVIPIVGSPDFECLMRHRAARARPSIEFGPPHFPDALMKLVRGKDPCQADPKVWHHKHLLILSGAQDRLVNFVDGGGARLVTRIESDPKVGSIEVVIEEKAGHELTESMMIKTSEWVWNRVLINQAEGVKAPAL